MMWSDDMPLSSTHRLVTVLVDDELSALIEIETGRRAAPNRWYSVAPLYPMVEVSRKVAMDGWSLAGVFERLRAVGAPEPHIWDLKEAVRFCRLGEQRAGVLALWVSVR